MVFTNAVSGHVQGLSTTKNKTDSSIPDLPTPRATKTKESHRSHRAELFFESKNSFFSFKLKTLLFYFSAFS